MRIINADRLMQRIKKKLCISSFDYLMDSEKAIINVIESELSIEIPTWIPCSERLPNKKEIVLITNDKGNVRCGQFRGTHGKYWIWKGNTLETVLAWMPLPSAYQGE